VPKESNYPAALAAEVIVRTELARTIREHPVAVTVGVGTVLVGTNILQVERHIELFLRRKRSILTKGDSKKQITAVS
jgi:hypothetical protein